MKTSEIMALQAQHPTGIVFVRDRIFWQCWESSAYLFTEFVRKYRVHHRHFKNLGLDLVWLGFPQASLEGIVKNLCTRGCAVQLQNQDAVVLSTPWQVEGFALWKQVMMQKADAQQEIKLEPLRVAHAADPHNKRADFLPVYRETYDLTIEVYKLSAKLSKDYKFSLGERLRQSTTDLLSQVHLAAGRRSVSLEIAIPKALQSLEESRLYLRMLKDLHQLNLERFARVNLNLEAISGQLSSMRHAA